MAIETKDMCCDVFFEERIDKKGVRSRGNQSQEYKNRGERQQITSRQSETRSFLNCMVSSKNVKAIKRYFLNSILFGFCQKDLYNL